MLKVADSYSVNETKKPSRIVRSVGCAALTLSLAATTCPTFGAPTARSVESLSAAERASLPNATLVTISKTHRTVSLGVLRSEHKLRLQRFANAAMFGKRASLKFEKKKKRASLGTLVPMNFSQQNFSDRIYGPFPGPFPADFLAFCKAAAVTACLYLPSGDLIEEGAWVWDMDPLITDPQMCTSEGGKPEAGACAYYYPTVYNLEFNPGPPTAQGYPVTHSATCPSPFGNTVDPRGAVSLDVLPQPAINANYYLSLTSLKTCIVRVFVKNLPAPRRLKITLPR